MRVCDLPVTVGRIQDGAGAFRGRILRSEVTPIAADAEEIARMARVSPAERQEYQTRRPVEAVGLRLAAEKALADTKEQLKALLPGAPGRDAHETATDP